MLRTVARVAVVLVVMLAAASLSLPGGKAGHWRSSNIVSDVELDVCRDGIRIGVVRNEGLFGFLDTSPPPPATGSFFNPFIAFPASSVSGGELQGRDSLLIDRMLELPPLEEPIAIRSLPSGQLQYFRQLQMFKLPWSRSVDPSEDVIVTYSDLSQIPGTDRYLINGPEPVDVEDCYLFSPTAIDPTPPRDLEARAMSQSRVDLQWDGSTDFVGVAEYVLARNDGAQFTIPEGAANAAGILAFSDTTVTAGSTYTYTVRAIDTDGNDSPLSNAVTVTTPQPKIVFTPDADADVYSYDTVGGNGPTINSGNATSLSVSRPDFIPGGEIITYLRFNLQNVTSLNRATLRLKSLSGDAVPFNVYLMDDVTWDEGAITYVTRPDQLGHGPLLGTASTTIAGWVEVELDMALLQATPELVDGNGLVSLALHAVNVTRFGSLFGSSETTDRDEFSGESYKPQLVVSIPETVAPIVSCGSDNGMWHAGNVAIGCTVANEVGGSPLDVLSPSSFDLRTHVPSGKETAAAATDSRAICDIAGNCDFAGPIGGIKVDRKAPTGIAVTGIREGGSYPYGSLPAAPTCQAVDGGSGVQNCTVSGYLTSVGTHLLSVTATDAVGNSATRQISYTVAPLTMRGFYWPVNMAPVVNTVKSGKTVPLIFEVFAGSKKLKDPAVVASLTTNRVACATGATLDAIELTTSGSTRLQSLPNVGLFIYHWQTPSGRAGQCATVTVTLRDGSSISANFKFK